MSRLQFQLPNSFQTVELVTPAGWPARLDGGPSGAFNRQLEQAWYAVDATVGGLLGWAGDRANRAVPTAAQQGISTAASPERPAPAAARMPDPCLTTGGHDGRVASSPGLGSDDRLFGETGPSRIALDDLLRSGTPGADRPGPSSYESDAPCERDRTAAPESLRNRDQDTSASEGRTAAEENVGAGETRPDAEEDAGVRPGHEPGADESQGGPESDEKEDRGEQESAEGAAQGAVQSTRAEGGFGHDSAGKENAAQVREQNEAATSAASKGRSAASSDLLSGEAEKTGRARGKAKPDDDVAAVDGHRTEEAEPQEREGLNADGSEPSGHPAQKALLPGQQAPTGDAAARSGTLISETPGAGGLRPTPKQAREQRSGLDAGRQADRQVATARSAEAHGDRPLVGHVQEVAATTKGEKADARPHPVLSPEVKTAQDGPADQSKSPADGEIKTPTPARATSSQDARSSSAARPQGPAGAEQADRVRMVERVARAFQTVGDRGGTVRLRLHPPELGSLRLEVTVRDGAMTARLEVETTAARNTLLDNLPTLRHRLAEHDVKVGRFDVDLSGQSGGDLPQRPGDQPHWHDPGHEGALGLGGSRKAEQEPSREARRIARPGEGGRLDVIV